MSRRTIQGLVDAVGSLVDDHVGIVRYVKELKVQPGAPAFFHFYAQACNTRAFSRQENFANAGGAAIDRSSALAKALGEAIERYCAALYDIEEFPLVSYENAPFACVDPRDFALYGPEQYESPDFVFVPFETSSVVRWSAGIDAQTGETIYVPAAMVFVPYTFYSDTGDSPIVQPISTGLACHSSPVQAALGAICEVIERDAFTLTWQARLPRRQICLDTLNPFLTNLIDRFQQLNRYLTLLDITTDVGVPTILSVLTSTADDAPALVVAAAADLNPERATQKSLEELAHTAALCQRLKGRTQHFDPGIDYANVVDQHSHLNYWCNHRHIEQASFLFESEEHIDLHEITNLAVGDPRRDFKMLVNRVVATGNKVILVDVTTSDVRELHLCVIRAVIPGFHPLQVGYKYRALGGSRLWTVPAKLGYAPITHESGDNPVPHPYP